MTSRCYEVETTVNAPVLQYIPHHTRLFIQVLLVLGINVLNDGVPTTGAIIFIDGKV